MNRTEIVGRLTRDPEFRANANGDGGVTRFFVAVNRKYKNAEGKYDADFISCVAFNKTAEFVQKYFTKGMAIGLTGRIQTGSYTNKDGAKVYTTDIVAEDVEFVESKNAAQNTVNDTANTNNGFMSIPDGVEDELPFA